MVEKKSAGTRKPAGTPESKAKELKPGQRRKGRDGTMYEVVHAMQKGEKVKKWKKICPDGEVKDSKTGNCRPSKARVSKVKQCRALLMVYEPKAANADAMGCRPRKVAPSKTKVCRSKGLVYDPKSKKADSNGCRQKFRRGPEKGTKKAKKAKKA